MFCLKGTERLRLTLIFMLSIYDHLYPFSISLSETLHVQKEVSNFRRE